MLESPAFSKYDTSSLASVGGGGAPAPAKLVDRVEKGFTRGRPNIGYGMTETNGFGPGNTGDDYVSHPNSTGRARISIMDIEIRDEDGNPVPTGTRGQIWMRGPNIIRCYWNKPEATAETIVDGWLASGDLGRIDEEGFLYIEDRAKDMVLRAGENVYCAEVESAIYEHGDVYEAAVFGVPHERLGEEVACVILRQPGTDLDADELKDFLAESLAPFKIPSRIAFADEQLPRNASGKILKRTLRDAYFATARLSRPAPSPPGPSAPSGRHRHPEEVLGRHHVVEDGRGLVEQDPDVRVALREVGDDQPAGAGVAGHPPGVGRGQVAVAAGQVRVGRGERGLAHHQVGPGGQVDGGVAHPGVHHEGHPLAGPGLADLVRAGSAARRGRALPRRPDARRRAPRSRAAASRSGSIRIPSGSTTRQPNVSGSWSSRTASMANGPPTEAGPSSVTGTGRTSRWSW